MWDSIGNTTNLLYIWIEKERAKDNESNIYWSTNVYKEMARTRINWWWFKKFGKCTVKNPKDGDAIQGTGGLRKIRIPMENKGKGKRGGARVIYVDIEIKEIIYFINVYTKNEKDDLSEDEKKAFKAMIKILKEV